MPPCCTVMVLQADRQHGKLQKLVANPFAYVILCLLMANQHRPGQQFRGRGCRSGLFETMSVWVCR